MRLVTDEGVREIVPVVIYDRPDDFRLVMLGRER